MKGFNLRYQEVYKKQRLGQIKRAFLGLFEDKPQPVTPQGQESWDPNTIYFQPGSPYHFDTKKIDSLIQKELRRHYAKVLAIAYKKATGKSLSAPEKLVNPRFNYILGRASGVKPALLKKLKQQDYNRIGGWTSGGRKTLQPGMIADAVDRYNAAEGHYQELQSGKKRQGPPLDLVVPN